MSFAERGGLSVEPRRTTQQSGGKLIMAGPDSIDAYLATLPVETHEVLERVRAAAPARASGAEETISYQLPTRTAHSSTGWTKSSVSLRILVR